jgi:hypothetical protein
LVIKTFKNWTNTEDPIKETKGRKEMSAIS